MKNKDDLISRDVFEHLVDLAAFALAEDEKNYLHEQMNHQLAAIRALEAIPLPGDLVATTHGVEYGKDGKPTLRNDEWKAYENTKEILAQAPDLQDGYIVVPDIPTTELQ
ncbi:MAG TPA: aspartyl/glutamyl-tRNA amidotransferase subunit C [Anaerolineaceae bacterium]|nr:aspartyl/glutamyl-tRNA amidotransferase subunit C [Anaerolineaceae bacterium]